MKLITTWTVVLLFAVSSLLAVAASAPPTVYVTPMAYGMDQYIANKLTNTHALEVTTDPSKAALVLTDRVDAALDEFLEDHKPDLRRPAEANPAVDHGQDGHAMTLPDMLILSGKTSSLSRASSLGRPKGTLFLVNVMSREIVWSTFEVPKGHSSKEFDRSARRVVERLKREFSTKE